MNTKNPDNNNPKDNQLKKYAEDLKTIYQLERREKMALETANQQIKKYAEDLKKTMFELKDANKKLMKQVEFEEREKLLQQKLIHANKMTSMGTMAAGIAHEINNPINFIMTNSQLLMEMFPDIKKILQKFQEDHGESTLSGLSLDQAGETIPQLLQANIEGARRVSNIIAGMKKYFSKSDSPLEEKVDINKVIKSSVSILNHQMKEASHFLLMELEEGIPSIFGDDQQLEQVMINILENSLQSLDNTSAKVTISSKYDKKKEEVNIRIKDEGKGMDKEVLNRITEPFFTTKRDSGGTGLGLYIVYSIIKEHQGTIEIKSEPGRVPKP